MPEKTHTIPLDTAEGLHELKDYGDPYGGYTPVHDEEIDSSRWTSIHQLIISRDSDDTLWSLIYEEPLTEMQDCNRFPGDPVTVERMRAEQYTATRYVPA